LFPLFAAGVVETGGKLKLIDEKKPEAKNLVTLSL
jgi:hypothetical protein